LYFDAFADDSDINRSIRKISNTPLDTPNRS